MNSKIFIFTFILAVLVNSCISEFNAKLPSTDIQILIVDGSIIENTDVIFYLSTSMPLSSSFTTNQNPIVANLYIIGNNGYKSMEATSLGNGAYRFSVGTLDDNVEYGLEIDYNGDVYKSSLSKPIATPEIDSVSWVQPEAAGNVSFRVSTHDDKGEAKFFLWSYTENWEVTAYYYNTLFFNPDSNQFYNDYTAPFYHCWKNSASHNLLIGSTESLSENRIVDKQIYNCLPDNDRFYYLYSLTVNQQAISKAAFEYYQNKIVLNDQMGGLFTPQPSELTGNITCVTDPSKRVMGFVETVKNITQKRKFVYAQEITHLPSYTNCPSITNDSIMYLFSGSETPYLDAYKGGYRPYGELSHSPPPTPQTWAYGFCTECTMGGGSKVKPDFWPNNDQ